MFTGIVTHRGEVRRARRDGQLLTLEIGSEMSRDLKPGDSVAVNGVCLTAIDVHRRRFVVQLVGETLARTTAGNLERGDAVNLELPARPIDRLGGHLVQGHVDGIATAIRIEEQDGSKCIWWRAEEDVLRYLVPKGSVALDGVSLTVVDVGRTSFEVALIPHTLDATTLHRVGVGSHANVEVDVIAKYVERLGEGYRHPRGAG